MPGYENLIEDAAEGVLIRIHVSPGAGETRVVGKHGDSLKIRVAAVPEKGRANEAVLAYLAEVFDIGKSDVAMVAGHTSRKKKVLIRGHDAETVERRIGVLIGESRGRK